MKHSEELFVEIFLNESSIPLLIDAFDKQSVIFGKSSLSEEEKQSIGAWFKTNEFLHPFSQQLEDLFSDEEILDLLKVYKSHLMRKLFSNYKEIGDSLYSAMRKEIDNRK